MKKFAKMKVLLPVTAILLIMGWIAAVDAGENARPFQLSLFSPVAIVPENWSIHGVRINLLYCVNKDMLGLDIGVVNRVNGNLRGYEYGLLFNYLEGNLGGYQTSFLVNVSRGNINGGQEGLVNVTKGDVSGFQFGVYNGTKNLEGVQIGGFNQAEVVKGFQLGICNITGVLDGLQVGLINVATQKKILKFLPIINAAW